MRANVRELPSIKMINFFFSRHDLRQFYSISVMMTYDRYRYLRRSEVATTMHKSKLHLCDRLWICCRTFVAFYGSCTALQQIHNKSNQWSLDFDLLWTCCSVVANRRSDRRCFCTSNFIYIFDDGQRHNYWWRLGIWFWWRMRAWMSTQLLQDVSVT